MLESIAKKLKTDISDNYISYFLGQLTISKYSKTCKCALRNSPFKCPFVGQLFCIKLDAG